ncbi:MAG: fructosamine kinase family protein [Cyanobacteriota bacterium]
MAAPSLAALRGWLARELPQLGDGPVLRLSPVGGGCIHAAWRLVLADGRCLFAKTNQLQALPMLQAEADGLRALAQAAAAAGSAGPSLTIPAPLAVGVLDGLALLVLPWLELGVRGGSEAWQQLGAGLARLHRASLPLNQGRGYGFEVDNFIGSGPQANGWLPEWGRFFPERRLAPQLAWLRRSGVGLQGAEALLERVPQWLAGHGAKPVLVHGDLWSGNAALLAGGGGTIFDPAAHWADREVDLAMARLFGGFPGPFFAGYNQEWPLPADAGRRVELYNLYHLLNHANLFDGGPGGSYGHQAQASLQRLLSQLG